MDERTKADLIDEIRKQIAQIEGAGDPDQWPAGPEPTWPEEGSIELARAVLDEAMCAADTTDAGDPRLGLVAVAVAAMEEGRTDHTTALLALAGAVVLFGDEEGDR